MINWKVRLKNPTFVFTVFIPGLIILIQMLAAFINSYVQPIGFTISEDAVGGALGIVNFIALTFFGIGAVIDPTSKGIQDSDEVKNQEVPK